MARILIVDDDAGVRGVLLRLAAAEGHIVTGAGDTADARRQLAHHAFELILCDINLPGESGLKLVQEVLATRTGVAVVMVSGADDPELADAALTLGAYGYIVKPFRDSEVAIAVANALRRRRLEIENQTHRDQLEQLVTERTAELHTSREQTVYRLARAAEFRDNETGQHIERVSRYSDLIARRLGLADAFSELLRTASPLHDIGKIAIPDHILRKPAPLSADERRVMETHTELGRAMLAGSGEPLLELAAEVAWTHHERFDGGGYPRAIAGDAIPIAGRIVAVADVFDALISDRVYRSAFAVDEVIAQMQAERAGHFDPDALDVLIASLPEAVAIRAAFRDESPQLRLATS